MSDASEIMSVEDAADVSGELTGFIDGFRDGNTLSGWVLRRDDFAATVAVSLGRSVVDAAVVESGIRRNDLAEHGDGCFGFRIRLARTVSSSELLAGAVGLVARSPGTRPFPIPFDRRIRARLLVEALDEVSRQLAACRDDDLELGAALARHETLPATSPAFPMLTAMLHRQPRPNNHAELAPLWLPVGLRSGCGTAELGTDGHLFLTGGTNQVARIYRQPMAEADVLASRWLALFRRRAGALLDRGIRYVQIVVPEKQTVVPNDLTGGTPTPLFTRLEAMINDDALVRAHYVSAFACFRRAAQARVYRRIDTHLSPYGSRLLYRAIAPVLGHAPCPTRPRGHGRIASGDLGQRFFGCQVFEVVQDMEEEDCVAARINVDRHALGAHIGRHYRWHNPRAAEGPRVLAFGNSFMDDAISQESLSYWLAGNCRDYEFRFSPAFQDDVIEEFRPDIVIGQTIERYLPVVPEH